MNVVINTMLLKIENMLVCIPSSLFYKSTAIKNILSETEWG